eukprot:gene26923-4546_t
MLSEMTSLCLSSIQKLGFSGGTIQAPNERSGQQRGYWQLTDTAAIKLESSEFAKLGGAKLESSEFAKLGGAELESSEFAKLGGAKLYSSEFAKLGGAELESSEFAKLGGAELESSEFAKLGGAKLYSSEFAKLGGVKLESSEFAKLGDAKLESSGTSRLPEGRLKALAESTASRLLHQSRSKIGEVPCTSLMYIGVPPSQDFPPPTRRVSQLAWESQGNTGITVQRW